jgi:hypothetical protein
MLDSSHFYRFSDISNRFSPIIEKKPGKAHIRAACRKQGAAAFSLTVINLKPITDNPAMVSDTGRFFLLWADTKDLVGKLAVRLYLT